MRRSIGSSLATSQVELPSCTTLSIGTPATSCRTSVVPSPIAPGTATRSTRIAGTASGAARSSVAAITRGDARSSFSQVFVRRYDTATGSWGSEQQASIDSLLQHTEQHIAIDGQGRSYLIATRRLGR